MRAKFGSCQIRSSMYEGAPLGKTLDLPRKCLTRLENTFRGQKHYSLYCRVIFDREKSFITLTTGVALVKEKNQQYWRGHGPRKTENLVRGKTKKKTFSKNWKVGKNIVGAMKINEGSPQKTKTIWRINRQKSIKVKFIKMTLEKPFELGMDIRC
jgi:hypothetical protein